jgi:hypothetical protein
VAPELGESASPPASANGGRPAAARRTGAFALPAVTAPTRAPGGRRLVPEAADADLALIAAATAATEPVPTGSPAGKPYRGPLLASWQQPVGGWWQPGNVYRAREVMGAVAAPAAPQASPAPIAVWSVTGRRLAAGTGAAVAPVLFAPGSRFVVLETCHPDTVLLRELAPGADVHHDPAADAVVRRRLHQLLAAYRRAPSLLRSAV